MKAFLLRISIYAIALILLNIGLGHYLRSYETLDLADHGVFFPKLRWQEYYATSEPLDVVILGSSHAYRSYEPKTMELAFGDGIQVFNMGSSAQSPITGYYVLQEILQTQQPRLVIMDIYFMVFTSDELLNNGLINWNYMKQGPAKSDFFWEGFSRQEQISSTLFPTFVYRKYFEPKVKKLFGWTYLPPERGHYSKKGFVGYADTLAMDRLQNNNQFDRFKTSTTDFTQKTQAYLLRIADLCREQGIPLVFSVAPIPEVSVQKIGNYPELSRYFEHLADSLRLPYVDFNRQRLPGLLDDVHYYDDDHLNLAGATYFSKVATELFKPELKIKD